MPGYFADRSGLDSELDSSASQLGANELDQCLLVAPQELRHADRYVEIAMIYATNRN
jgi:hypothetical protein